MEVRSSGIPNGRTNDDYRRHYWQTRALDSGRILSVGCCRSAGSNRAGRRLTRWRSTYISTFCATRTHTWCATRLPSWRAAPITSRHECAWNEHNTPTCVSEFHTTVRNDTSAASTAARYHHLARSSGHGSMQSAGPACSRGMFAP